MRNYLIADAKGEFYRSFHMDTGELRLASCQGALPWADFRKVRIAAEAFATLQAARDAVYSEIRYRERFPDFWSLERISEWAQALRIVPVSVTNGSPREVL